MNKTRSSHLRFILHPSSFILCLGALSWVVFARWVMPPLLRVEHPGRTIAAVKP
jgi:hypothetical protein